VGSAQPRAERVELGDGVRLNVDQWDGSARPVLLVHGLASNARLWRQVGERLARRGHRVVAVDQRGHGRSDRPVGPYGITTAVADLVELIGALDLARPVVAGQSWGGNVVLQLAHDRPDLVHAAALVDGGWIRLRDTFSSWEACARQLRPPPLAGSARSRVEAAVRLAHPGWSAEAVEATMANFEELADGTIRPWLSLEHHLTILRDLWDHEPAMLYGAVTVPVLLAPADHGTSGDGMAAKRRAVAEASERLAAGRVSWFGPPADHDVHAQFPDELAELLAALAEAGSA
jgi:pimeloyl-ACP methyl ester carboxylesterase